MSVSACITKTYGTGGPVSCYAETYAVGLRELKTARYVYLLSRRERSEHRDDDTTDVLIQALSHLVEDQTGQKTY